MRIGKTALMAAAVDTSVKKVVGAAKAGAAALRGEEEEALHAKWVEA